MVGALVASAAISAHTLSTDGFIAGAPSRLGSGDAIDRAATDVELHPALEEHLLAGQEPILWGPDEAHDIVLPPMLALLPDPEPQPRPQANEQRSNAAVPDRERRPQPKPRPKVEPKPDPKPRVVLVGRSGWRTAPHASWYGPGFYGNTTACGQRYTQRIVGVAHRTLPCGTLVQLRWRGMTVVAPVIDRGPYGHPSNVFDFSARLACQVLRPRGEPDGCFTRHDIRWRVVDRKRVG